MKPQRVQRKRTRGWCMPVNTTYVGRPSRWGNPYSVPPHTLDESLRTYQRYVHTMLNRDPHWLDPLRGKNLACWCPFGQPCHADILLELANS